jgi:PleD family two-component response regulator
MSKPRVLIVDDDASISRLISMLLEKTGRYDVRTENLSQHAPEVAREFQPTCSFSMSTCRVRTAVNSHVNSSANPSLARTPVIFFTSLVSADETSGGEIMRGGQRYLAKTTNVSVISGCIDRALAAVGR